MSKNKTNPHEPVREINSVSREVKRMNREEQQKIHGATIVKWIFGVLILLSILYIIWTRTIVG